MRMIATNSTCPDSFCKFRNRLGYCSATTCIYHPPEDSFKSVELPISAAPAWRDAKINTPKKNGRYLVTKMVFDTPRVEFACFSTNLKDLLEFKYCGDQYNRPGWYNGDSEGDWEETNIIGWMPEPEPMKPEPMKEQEV